MRTGIDLVFALLAAAFGPLLATCGTEGGHQPVARFSVSPKYVCAGDNHLTVVTMDATLSSDPVDDPPGKALACSSDSDCPSGRLCTGTGAPPDPVTQEVPRLCLFPLKYAWEIGDETFVKTDGDFAGLKLSGTFAGDRPYDVTLRVTDRNGDSISSTSTVGITAVHAPPCDADLDCPQGYLCADPLGEGKACYADCELEEGICNFCPEEGAACARCYLCEDSDSRHLCLPAQGRR
ncbi:MAG: hypothetical protein HY897_11265 [Deltaproteobacteria bacterium]|nr:hypothetical protein [Deltaproteobacteria bacterium]